MTTSHEQTSPSGEDELTYSLADFLASHSVMPGGEEARRMTATSGQACIAPSMKSSPLGLWLKTLLASSRWSSRARFLRWQVQPLYSQRLTTFEDNINCERPLPCNASALTLKVTDTQSSRFLYRLVPSEPPHRRDRVFIVARRIASDTDNRTDRRTAGEDEGKGGAQRIQERHEVRKPDEPNQVRPESGDAVEHRHAADTIDEGLQGRHDCDTQGHGQSSDGCTRQLREVHDGERPTADPVSGGSPSSGENAESNRPRTNDIQGQAGRGQGHSSVGTDGLSSVLRNTADTDNERQPGRCSEDRGEWSDIARVIWREFLGIAEGHHDYEVGERWSNFPSVSPVHRGNDGLPFDVDGLTISFGKWRTEALKAYGNAICPQVMYEIMRAIEIVEKGQNT